MHIEIYLAFVVASVLLILAPGPSNMVIVSHALGFGFRRSARTILGVAFSHALFFSIAAFGLDRFLMASATGFYWLKWIGAGYLIWIGIQQWRSKVPDRTSQVNASKRSNHSLFWQGFLVNSTNPKALVFYAVFFPPFLDTSLSVPTQLLVLGITFLLILIVISLFFAALASRTATFFGSRRKLQNRITGSVMVGAGAALAAVNE